MYQNVGLKTPRGSGTSGYVQKNVSFVKPLHAGREGREDWLDQDRLMRPGDLPARKPGADVQEHMRRRAIELELLDFREAWLAAHPQATAQEADEKVARQRAFLLQGKASDAADDERAIEGTDFGRKEEDLQRMRHALGISAERVEGEAFKQINNAQGLTDDERRELKRQQWEQRQRDLFYQRSSS